MPYYFTTLTLIDNIPFTSLITYLQTKDKYLLVKEKGKNGDNPHYHIIFKQDDEKRTDKITAQIKSLYTNLPTESRNLVWTKVCHSWQKTYKNYLLKESLNKTFSSLTYGGFDTPTLKRLFKEAQQSHLMCEKVFVSFKNAPYVIFDFNQKFKILDNSQWRDSTVFQILKIMVQHRYIVHHLFDERMINKITIAIKCLSKGYIEDASED